MQKRVTFPEKKKLSKNVIPVPATLTIVLRSEKQKVGYTYQDIEYTLDSVGNVRSYANDAYDNRTSQSYAHIRTIFQSSLY